MEEGREEGRAAAEEGRGRALIWKLVGVGGRSSLPPSLPPSLLCFCSLFRREGMLSGGGREGGRAGGRGGGMCVL